MKQLRLAPLKTFLICLFALFFSSNFLFAQDTEDGFVRKGRILVETGYNLFGGLSNSSGLGVYVDTDGDNLTTFGFNGGYFVSENFALKARLDILSTGETITNFGIGGKYYAGGRVPIDLNLGFIGFSGDASFIGDLSVGYAIPLADNIALEPSLGLILSENSSLIKVGFSFSMFL